MKKLATIPQEQIQQIGIYINTAKKTLAQIKLETGADYIVNGGLFDMSKWQPYCHLKANGKTYVSDEYKYDGYGWNVADIRMMSSAEKDRVANFICCTALVVDGKPIAKPIYNAALGGARGRTAIGLKQDGSLLLFCSKDGTEDAMRPEALRDVLVNAGAYSAVMLDGGASSQCDFAGDKITSGRVVHNLVCVWLKRNAPKKPVVCLDAGHGGTDHSNRSPDAGYYEHEFALDLANRTKAVLEAQGVKVVMTREADTTVSLTDRAKIANRASADLFVSLHSNASGSGWSSPRGLCAYTCAAGGKRDELAGAIIKRCKDGGVQIFSDGLYHSRFTVLTATNAPACLVECGFHTNREDVVLLSLSAYRDRLASYIAHGICDALGRAWSDATPKTYKLTARGLSRADAANLAALAAKYNPIIEEE